MTTIYRSEFFSNTAQIEYLVQTALPELIRTFGSGVKRKLIVWSAGCRSGEEPYTLAMVLSEFGARYPGLCFEFLVLATEDSSDSLDLARNGIYDENHIDPVPLELRRKYVMRSRDRARHLVRMAPELREVVRFRKVDSNGEMLFFREPIDIIFCCNALNSMKKAEREILLNDFCRHLVPGGYIFMGESHDPARLRAPLVPVAPAIYRKSTV